jgi:hypothetical protein
MNEILGFCDPNYRVQNIPILKNATTYLATTLSNLNWHLKYVPIDRKIKRFVILRDPYERWLTAFTQDLSKWIYYRSPEETKELENIFYNGNVNLNWFIDFLIDRDVLCFDAHAQLQTQILNLIFEVLPQEQIAFFKMTDKLGQALNYWLHNEGCPNNLNNAKIHARSNEDELHKKISTYFFDGKNLRRKEKVLDYLKADYELYNKVTFVNAT